MQECDFECSDTVEFDSVLHRYSSRSDKPNDKDEWYVAHEWEYQDKAYCSVTFGSWRIPESKKVWHSWGTSQIDTENYKIFKEKEAKAKAKIEIAREIQEKKSMDFYLDLPDLDTPHPYLEKKGFDIAFDGLKTFDDKLIIPKQNESGKIKSFEIIYPDGFKRCAKGCTSKNLFYKFDGDPQRIFICEGFATGASIHLCTGATVYCAFSASNCENIAMAARYHNKSADIVLCQDLGEAGDIAAEKCKLLGIDSIKPEGCGSDFNDMHQEVGEEKVEEVLRSRRLMPLSITEFLKMDIPPPEFLFHKMLPKSSSLLLMGQTGVGKSYIGFEMAYCLAMGITFIKWKCENSHKVLYIENEIDRYEVKERLVTLDDSYSQKKVPDDFCFDLMDKVQIEKVDALDLSCESSRKKLDVLFESYDVIFLDNYFSLVKLMEKSGTDSHVLASCWDPIKCWFKALESKGKTIVMIHHSNIDGTNRGTRNMMFGFETIINLVSEDPQKVPDQYKNIITINFVKSRKMIAKEKIPVRIGYDSSGVFACKWEILEKPTT